MTVEERVARILAEMGEEVQPLPDPYGRVRAGLRRRRRRRLIGLGLVTLTLLSATGVALAGAPVDRHPPTGAGTGQERLGAWTRRLVDSPPRGAVAADTAYATALAQLVFQRQERGQITAGGQIAGASGRYEAARTLFVADVGSHRVGLVALLYSDADATSWLHGATWLVADRGASAADLAATATTAEALGPYMEWRSREGRLTPAASVAVAPAECEFATAAGPEQRDWRREPTGSYIVRTDGTPAREWWRVTCGGQVRELRRGPGATVDERFGGADLDAAAATSRRGREPSGWREPIMSLATQLGWAAAGVPRAVWTGRLVPEKQPADGAFVGDARVVAARRAAGGGWLGRLTYARVDPAANTEYGLQVDFTTGVNPTDPSLPVAIPVGHEEPTRSVLVIVPEGATRVTAQRGGRTLGEAAVVDGGALLLDLDVPVSDVELRAVHPSGGTKIAVVASRGWDLGEVASWDS